MRRLARFLITILLLLVALDFAAIILTPLLMQPQPSDFAVAFGNTVTSSGTPSARLRARLDTAAVLYREHTATHILVSGGYEVGVHQDEADAMARYLVAQGIPATAILEDHHGDDSLSTAVNSRKMLPANSSVVVVTQWFHVARATVIMHRMGFENVSADWPRFFEARDLYSFFREAAALPFYAVRPVSAAPVAQQTPASQHRQ